MHRSIAGHNRYNPLILKIGYSKNLTTSWLLTIEHMAMFVVKSIHIQIYGQVMDVSIILIILVYQSATPTSISGTQTSSASASTSTTQTAPGARAQAFVVPGMPGLAQNISPVDGYLPCSSRHFLTQHARSIIQQGQASGQGQVTTTMARIHKET